MTYAASWKDPISWGRSWIRDNGSPPTCHPYDGRRKCFVQCSGMARYSVSSYLPISEESEGHVAEHVDRQVADLHQGHVPKNPGNLLRLLTDPGEGARRVWFLLDELGSLQKLPQVSPARNKCTRFSSGLKRMTAWCWWATCGSIRPSKPGDHTSNCRKPECSRRGLKRSCGRKTRRSKRPSSSSAAARCGKPSTVWAGRAVCTKSPRRKSACARSPT